MNKENINDEVIKKSTVYDVFDTHKFFYTLNYQKKIEGLEVFFLDKSSNEISIKLSKIEIGTSPVSCNLFDEDGKRYRVPFLKIRKVLDDGELAWDNTDVKHNNSKTIPGWK